MLMVMVGWADKWLAGDAGPPVLYRHRACGEISHVDLRCAHCGQPMHADDIELPTGPVPRHSHVPAVGDDRARRSPIPEGICRVGRRSSLSDSDGTERVRPPLRKTSPGHEITA